MRTLVKKSALMRAFAGAGFLLLAGCTVGPDFVPPEPDAGAGFGAALPDEAGARAEAILWWQGFNDDRLSGLIAKALGANYEIAAARERLLQARALVEAEAGAGGPQLDGALTGDVASRTGGGGQNGQTEGEVGAGALFSWVPDLFGGQRRAVEAAEAESLARALLEEDIARLTAADVARRYTEARRDYARLGLVNQSLDLQRETLRLVETRFEAGLTARLDVKRAEADLAATRAQAPQLERSAQAALHALAVLTGERAGDFAKAGIGEGSIPAFRGGPAAGLPREMVRRRADIRAAEAQLARATALIGVEEADLYPLLSLPGRLSFNLEDLGSGNVAEVVVATLSATLDIPLFDAGTRRAEISAAEARAREALLLYRQSVLDALREVETALVSVISARARQDYLSEAVAASEDAFQQAENLYSQGLASFTEVLDAQRSLLSNRQELAIAKSELALAFIDLYAAAGAPTAPLQ